MERRALITREQASDDSRGAWVVLSDEGAQTFRRVSSPHLHSVQQMFVSALSSEQLAALDDAMRALDFPRLVPDAWRFFSCLAAIERMNGRSRRNTGRPLHDWVSGVLGDTYERRSKHRFTRKA
jgi:hypothetical protein